MAAQGVKIKDYEGNKQREFKSKDNIGMYDAEGHTYNGEVPYNSRVRLKYKTGPAHPAHGTPVYLEAVNVLEEPEPAAEPVDF